VQFGHRFELQKNPTFILIFTLKDIFNLLFNLIDLNIIINIISADTEKWENTSSHPIRSRLVMRGLRTLVGVD
jgi:hypothetical protein